jgi:MFS family permease
MAIIHIIFFGSCGAVLGFLLGIAIPPRWRRGGRWKTALASAIGSVVGAVAGPVIGVLLLLVTGARLGGSSDGSGLAGVFLFFAFFAVVGFLLGFAIPLTWHFWKLRKSVRQSYKDPVEHSAQAGPVGDCGGESSPRR